MWPIVVVLCASGCGRLDFDPVGDAAGSVMCPQAYIKASNTGANDHFGSFVALSADGTTLAVSAFDEDSAATGIDGDQVDNSAVDSGAVYVFVCSGSAWSQQAYVKASNTEAGDRFGRSIALAADGNTMAVSANLEDSAATGVDGNQADNSAVDSGAVYVFVRAGTAWTQQAYFKASNTRAGDNFGTSVALSADGATLAVSAYSEDSGATGVGGNQLDNSAVDSGAVYVFTRPDATWTQQAYIKASNTDAGDLFGETVALSADGNTLAVAAPIESSAASGIGGNQADNSKSQSGAVYVLVRAGTVWSQQAYIKASNPDAFDQFGWDVALSANGDTLAVGARFESSGTTGIDGNQADNSAGGAGAAYVFSREATVWTQQAYVKPSNAGASDLFGELVAVSGTGDTLVASSAQEDSASGTDPSDNSATDSGACYAFTRSGATWTPGPYIKASRIGAGNLFGEGLAVSSDGGTLAVGAVFEDSCATGVGGDESDTGCMDGGAIYVLSAR